MLDQAAEALATLAGPRLLENLDQGTTAEHQRASAEAAADVRPHAEAQPRLWEAPWARAAAPAQHVGGAAVADLLSWGLEAAPRALRGAVVANAQPAAQKEQPLLPVHRAREEDLHERAHQRLREQRAPHGRGTACAFRSFADGRTASWLH